MIEVNRKTTFLAVKTTDLEGITVDGVAIGDPMQDFGDKRLYEVPTGATVVINVYVGVSIYLTTSGFTTEKPLAYSSSGSLTFKAFGAMLYVHTD